MSPTPTVSVVMATYNRRAALDRVVDALLADPGLTELVAVVDGCADGSLELLRERARRDDRLLPIWTENGGPSRAQQLGLECARGEVVVMFDDDQIAGPGLASGHARHHTAGERLVVVGYVPPPPPGPGARFMERSYAEAYERDCASWEAGEPILDVLWGGNLSLRRADLLEIGWENPGFPHRYHYDWEFGLRCAEAGFTAVFDRELFALHEYARRPDRFAMEAREQGRALRHLSDLHPAAVPAGGYARKNGVTGELQRLARRRRIAALLAGGLLAGTYVAHGARAPRLEDRLGQALWAVEAQRGMIDEDRRLRGVPA